MDNKPVVDIWPEWHINKQIGMGSFGVVYEAIRTDHSVESRSAIKVISIPQNQSELDYLRSEGLSQNATKSYLQGVVNDFIREIQLMESFKGVQNIVSVEDYRVIEKTDGVGWDIYIRMELLTPLSSYLDGKEVSEDMAIKLGIDICTALELCSKHSVIHRDIKPQNILVNQYGDFKLGDFGIARKLENLTSGLSQKGSPNYMAPEVAKGAQYDATIDIYSLGIVLYQLLNNNHLPFLDTEQQLLNPNERALALGRRLNGEPLPAPCKASPQMAQIILRACSPDPQKRFASATLMKTALQSAASGGYTAPENETDKTLPLLGVAQYHEAPKAPPTNKSPLPQPKAEPKVSPSKHGNKLIIGIFAASVLIFLLFVIGVGVFLVSWLTARSANNTVTGAYPSNTPVPAMEETLVIPEATPVVTPQALYCFNCNQLLTDPNAKYCSYCGIDLEQVNFSPSDEPATPQPTVQPLQASLLSQSEAQQLMQEQSLRYLTIKDTQESSIVKQKGTHDNSAHAATDGNTDTSWQEGVDGDGIGESITLDLGRTMQVQCIEAWLGNWRSDDWYSRNNVPSKLLFILYDDDGHYEEFSIHFPKEKKKFCIGLNRPTTARYVQIVVEAVYPGSKYDDTCIAEIRVCGYGE